MLIIAVVLTVLIEAAHWVTLRWDFDEVAAGRAWTVTIIIIAVAATITIMETTVYSALPELLNWSPMLLLPMQLLQSYALRNELPLDALSLRASQTSKSIKNAPHQIIERNYVNFGNIYFIATIIAATLGSAAHKAQFLPGVIFLLGWILLSKNRSKPIMLVVTLLFCSWFSLIGQEGLNRLSQAIKSSRFGHIPDNENQSEKESIDTNTISTRVGTPGRIELSPKISWRLRLENNSPKPELLRLATYTEYKAGSWKVSLPEAIEYKALDQRSRNNIPYFLSSWNLSEADQSQAISNELPRFKLRGQASENTPLPLPGNVSSLRDFEHQGMDRNQVGTLRIAPENSIIEGTVLWQGKHTAEEAPFEGFDTKVPLQEQEVIKQIVKQLKLNEQQSLRDKLVILKKWLDQEFSYTLEPTIQAHRYVNIAGETAIAQFLTKNRKGHCDYFASATVLILRSAGIPARYTAGYSVAERNAQSQEYILRGTHRHAWCRVWDQEAGKWIDFDTTPRSGFAASGTEQSLYQKFLDAIQCYQENFYLWRKHPDNQLSVLIGLYIIGAGFMIFIGHRLWRTKTKLVTSQNSKAFDGVIAQTALSRIEGKARKLLGPRPISQPLSIWLRQLKIEPSLLEEALELHLRLRFDPVAPKQADQERLTKLAKQIEAKL